MEDIINVRIKTEHFRESFGYQHITACPLAIALSSVFKYPVYVGGNDVDIDDPNGPVTYKFDDNLWESGMIMENIRKAKDGEEIEPVYLELRKV